jgi:hypothetical protein
MAGRLGQHVGRRRNGRCRDSALMVPYDSLARSAVLGVVDEPHPADRFVARLPACSAAGTWQPRRAPTM